MKRLLTDFDALLALLLLQICIHCVPRFAGIFCLSEQVSIVSGSGFLLTTTLLFAFRRNRSRRRQRDDMDGSYKIHINQCSNLLYQGVTRLDGARGKKQVWRPHVRT